jgi:hypothetical protein
MTVPFLSTYLSPEICSALASNAVCKPKTPCFAKTQIPVIMPKSVVACAGPSDEAPKILSAPSKHLGCLNHQT